MVLCTGHLQMLIGMSMEPLQTRTDKLLGLKYKPQCTAKWDSISSKIRILLRVLLLHEYILSIQVKRQMGEPDAGFQPTSLQEASNFKAASQTGTCPSAPATLLPVRPPMVRVRTRFVTCSKHKLTPEKICTRIHAATQAGSHPLWTRYRPMRRRLRES